jgi:hypothetical protein
MKPHGTDCSAYKRLTLILEIYQRVSKMQATR